MKAVTACQGTNPGPSRQSVRLPGSNDVPDKCPRSASQLCQVSLGTVGVVLLDDDFEIFEIVTWTSGTWCRFSTLQIFSWSCTAKSNCYHLLFICCSLLIGVVAAGWRQENSSWGWSSGSAEEGLGIDAAWHYDISRWYTSTYSLLIHRFVQAKFKYGIDVHPSIHPPIHRSIHPSSSLYLSISLSLSLVPGWSTHTLHIWYVYCICILHILHISRHCTVCSVGVYAKLKSTTYEYYDVHFCCAGADEIPLGSCFRDTGGTCRFFSCDASRGEASFSVAVWLLIRLNEVIGQDRLGLYVDLKKG